MARQGLEHLQDNVTFQQLAELEVNGVTWDVGIASINPNANAPNLTYPVALPKDRSYVLMFHTNLLDAEGKVEAFQLIHQSPSNWSLREKLSADLFPKPLVETLESIANDYICHFDATPNALLSSNRNLSHVVTIHGERWGVGVSRTEDGGVYPVAWGMNTPQAHVWLLPESIDEARGVVEHFSLRVSPNDESLEYGEQDVPPRLIEELERYANRFKCFGRHTDSYQRMLDTQVDLAAGIGAGEGNRTQLLTQL